MNVPNIHKIGGNIGDNKGKQQYTYDGNYLCCIIFHDSSYDSMFGIPKEEDKGKYEDSFAANNNLFYLIMREYCL